MPADTVRYLDGTEAHVGDVVSEHGDLLAVEAVVTARRVAEFGVSAPGVMLVGLPYGRLFLSVNDFEDEDGGLVFVARQV